MNSNQLAYIAGIIDGEGCITILKSKKKHCVSYGYSPSVFVVMTSEPVITWLAETIGSGFITTSRPRPDNRRNYRYNLTGSKAIQLVKDIYPYLVEKKAQAETICMIEPYIMGKGTRPTQAELDAKEHIYQGLKALHL
jgi:hypothetical protein